MIEYFENEVVEFKEAKNNFSFNDIGKYFSALGNEASVSEIYKVLEGTLPAHIKEKKQKLKKVSNILQSMKKDGLVEVKGTGHSAKWLKSRQT